MKKRCLVVVLALTGCTIRNGQESLSTTPPTSDQATSQAPDLGTNPDLTPTPAADLSQAADQSPTVDMASPSADLAPPAPKPDLAPAPDLAEKPDLTPSCPANTTFCPQNNAGCVNLLTDNTNCGACAKVCVNGTSCNRGQCEVDKQGLNCGQKIACGQDCIDVVNDPLNCGGCGVVCSANNIQGNSPSCTGKVCGGQCSAPFADCDHNSQKNGCESNTQTDSQNCGSCGNVCQQFPHSISGCVFGACEIAVCDDGWADCDWPFVNGCETDTNSDSRNCGGCWIRCAQGFSCVQGVCTPPPCPQGQTRCNGACVDTSTSNLNCGACNQACGQGDTCVAGVCTPPKPLCPQGQTSCGGACKDLQSDASNCGACGNVCPQNNGCYGGGCYEVRCWDKDRGDGSGTCHNTPNCYSPAIWVGQNLPIPACGGCQGVFPNAVSCCYVDATKYPNNQSWIAAGKPCAGNIAWPRP